MGKILWYKNIGTKNNPRLASAKPVEVEWNGKNLKPSWFWWTPKGKNLSTQWRTTPLIFDWNKDGLMDLIMLDYEGFLAFFERVNKDGEFKLLEGKRIFYNENNELLQLNSKIAGKSGRRKLTIVDWDLDGKLDLLVNSKNVNYLKNISTSSEKVVLKDMGMVSEQILAGHTSIEHPWFKASCEYGRNKYTDRYIWTNSMWDGNDDNIKLVNGYADRDGSYAINYFYCQPALNYGFAKPDPKKTWQQSVDAPEPQSSEMN